MRRETGTQGRDSETGHPETKTSQGLGGHAELPGFSLENNRESSDSGRGLPRSDCHSEAVALPPVGEVTEEEEQMRCCGPGWHKRGLDSGEAPEERGKVRRERLT